MKTYVLLLSKTFMKGHSRAGQLTNFEQKIRDGIKIHTLRTNYEYWKKIVDQVNDGKAILSVREWTDKPYNSKQIELMQFKQLGIEKAIYNSSVSTWFIIDDGKNNHHETYVCINDGLSIEDFKEWFKSNKTKPDEPLAIIHFTQYRYKDDQFGF